MLHVPPEILLQILAFVKADSYALIAPVCSAFRGCYLESEKVTRISAFFESPQLLKQAPPFQFQNPRLLDDLITRNQIAIIPALLSRGLEWDHFCVERAAEVNSYAFFEWLIGTDLAWLPENAHCSAAASGNLCLMKRLIEMGAGYPDSRSLMVAQKLRDVGIATWLDELQRGLVYQMVRAAREDNVYVFDRLGDFEGHPVEAYVREACAYGSLGVLEFFRSAVGVLPSARDVAVAVQLGRGEILEWVVSE